MSKAIRDLLALAHRFGSDAAHVVGSGGNVSYKNGETLWVKASGVCMANLTEENLVRLNRASLSAMQALSYPADLVEREQEVATDLMLTMERGQGACCEKTPSVDALLHEAMPQAFVLHTHPALVNGLTCAKNGKAAAEKLFGKRAAWVAAVEPGISTGKAVVKAVAAHVKAVGKAPTIVLIENHGLVVAGDSAKAVEAEAESVYAAISHAAKKAVKQPAKVKDVPADDALAAKLAPAIRMLASGGKGGIVVFRTDGIFGQLTKDASWKKDFATALTPDHALFCSFAPCWIPAKKTLEAQYDELRKQIGAFQKKHGESPRLVLVEGLGVFAAGCCKGGTERIFAMAADAAVAAGAAMAFGGAKPLGGKRLAEIQEWNEKLHHRGGNFSGRIAQKIVIVTGAAQGFGQGVAEELLAEGANVVIADLNYDLANQNAQAYCVQYGAGRALAVAVNVGDADSVEQMVRKTVLAYGGLDVIVSNAGVLRAGGLDKMDAKTFEFMTKINYTGYFLCAQKASDVMKIQHAFAPGYSADIIQINSKSGLSGSKNNFAYAGGKFGGIGLTQSFALELVDWNIKVNSICPGNFFDGPLWSDPKNGLFVQYLKAGKVAGAKTVADVKRAYESKVPMNRGCGVKDVARAILYVIEQQYETGQAIPVTGGQNMLK